MKGEDSPWTGTDTQPESTAASRVKSLTTNLWGKRYNLLVHVPIFLNPIYACSQYVSYFSSDLSENIVVPQITGKLNDRN